jgi:hypothetical protein
MKYTIDTKHEKGDTVFFSQDGKIVETKIDSVHAMLKSDGTYTVFYG